MQLQNLDSNSDTCELPESQPLPLVSAPADGLPEIVVTDAALRDTIAAIKAGTGPVALDAERASGFRYRQRAYLIQLRRHGSGTHLIDPTAFDDLNDLNSALHGVDWILHAASQDLVCLAELGLRPSAQLFDTELAGRLLGLARVGLGPLVEEQIGVSLAKEHSAADWSTRPLPEPWLNYAALDVEYLIELWALLEAALIETTKYEWALQEFEHVKNSTVAIERVDAWRRTSGMHKLHTSRELAVVREVWQQRDVLARSLDTAPGRMLPDAAIVALAASQSQDRNVLLALPEMKHRYSRRNQETWIQSVVSAHALSEADLPPVRVKSGGPPPPRNWMPRHPQAFAALENAKEAVAALSESVSIPVENLMTPDHIRRIMWDGASSIEDVHESLRDLHARTWQIDLVAPLIWSALEANPR